MRNYLFSALLLLVSACGGACSQEPAADRALEQPVHSEERGGSDDDSGKKLATVQNQQVAVENAKESAAEPTRITERKIVRDAVFGLESAAPVEAQKKIAALAGKYDGYVIESTNNAKDDAVLGGGRIRLVLRIPSDKFQTVLEEIRKAADTVVSETVTGKDVTEQFVDIQARLKAKRALEDQFLEIMKQATNVKDALNVQRELANVRSEIEVIEGKLRLLENQTSFSKITVNIGPPNTVGSSSTGFWYQLKDAVSDGIEGALTFILILVRVLIALIPFLLLVVLPILLLLRYLWRRYRQNRMARAAALEVEKITDDIE